MKLPLASDDVALADTIPPPPGGDACEDCGAPLYSSVCTPCLMADFAGEDDREEARCAS